MIVIILVVGAFFLPRTHCPMVNRFIGGHVDLLDRCRDAVLLSMRPLLAVTCLYVVYGLACYHAYFIHLVSYYNTIYVYVGRSENAVFCYRSGCCVGTWRASDWSRARAGASPRS